VYQEVYDFGGGFTNENWCNAKAQASIVGFAQAVEALEKLAYSISVLYVDDGSFFHTIHMAR